MTFKNIFARKTNRLVNRKFTPLWLFVSGAALEACGSSDGGGDAILQEFYAEGAAGGALFTVDAADPTSLEAVDITYQIQSQTDSSGNDIALFVINSRGEVTIAPGAVFDYENPEGISETDFLSLTPAERDNANIYNIKIVATIKANDETTETETTFTYAVKITDEPDAAVLSTMSNVKPTGTVSVSPPSADNTNDIEIPIADFLKAFDDQDTHSDNQINQLSFSDIPTGVALRYGGNVIETGDIFDIRAGGTIVATIDENVAVGEVVLEYSGFEGGIAITGASLSFSVTNAPNIGSVTDAANEVVVGDGDGVRTIEILENTADDIAIFKIAVSDIDADQALSYSLEGADAGLFDVNPDGTDANIALITFRSAVGADGAFSPDFEVPGSDGGDNIYSITFVVIDNLGGSSNLDLGVTILDQDEAATDIILSSEAIAEDETATQIGGNDVYLVGTLSVTDPDGADSGFTVNALSLAADELDGGSFVIDDNKLYLKHKPDFETKSSYSVTIIATGSGVAAPSYTETITVNVEGVNEAPTLSDSVSLGDVKKGNADTDGKDLTILQLLSGAGYSDQDVDDNLDNISKIEITSISDAGNLVLTYTDSVDTPVTLAVGDLIALDGTLDGNINVKIKDSVADDTLFTVGYKVYDSGGLASDEASLTFTATSVAVNFDGVLPVTLEENSATSDPIATVSASVDGTGYGAISYSLIGDNSNLFEIDSASGEITLTGELDYEVAKEHALTVLVTAMHTSGATITSSTLVTVNVNDVDETPTKIEIVDDNDDLETSIEENKEADQIDGNDVYFVGAITVTDPDGADSGFTNALTLGGTNASSFVIDDNKLYLKHKPDFEGLINSYSVTIIANDLVPETRYETDAITITVDNVDDLADITVFAADGITLIDDPIAHPAEIDENVDEQTLYIFSGTDEDKNALDVNQIVKFEIDNTVGHGSLFQLIEDSAASKWALSFKEAPNFEAVNAPAGNLYSVIVTAYSVDADGDEVTDTQGNRVEVLTTVNVQVGDVNEDPSIILPAGLPDSYSVAGSFLIGTDTAQTIITTLNADDPDNADDINYVITGVQKNLVDAPIDSFTINSDGEIRFADTYLPTDTSQYSVTVGVKSTGGEVSDNVIVYVNAASETTLYETIFASGTTETVTFAKLVELANEPDKTASHITFTDSEQSLTLSTTYGTALEIQENSQLTISNNLGGTQFAANQLLRYFINYDDGSSKAIVLSIDINGSQPSISRKTGGEVNADGILYGGVYITTPPATDITLASYEAQDADGDTFITFKLYYKTGDEQYIEIDSSNAIFGFASNDPSNDPSDNSSDNSSEVILKQQNAALSLGDMHLLTGNSGSYYEVTIIAFDSITAERDPSSVSENSKASFRFYLITNNIYFESDVINLEENSVLNEQLMAITPFAPNADINYQIKAGEGDDIFEISQEGVLSFIADSTTNFEDPDAILEYSLTITASYQPGAGQLETLEQIFTINIIDANEAPFIIPNMPPQPIRTPLGNIAISDLISYFDDNDQSDTETVSQTISKIRFVDLSYLELEYNDKIINSQTVETDRYFDIVSDLDHIKGISTASDTDRNAAFDFSYFVEDALGAASEAISVDFAPTITVVAPNESVIASNSDPYHNSFRLTHHYDDGRLPVVYYFSSISGLENTPLNELFSISITDLNDIDNDITHTIKTDIIYTNRGVLHTVKDINLFEIDDGKIILSNGNILSQDYFGVLPYHYDLVKYDIYYSTEIVATSDGVNADSFSFIVELVSLPMIAPDFKSFVIASEIVSSSQKFDLFTMDTNDAISTYTAGYEYIIQTQVNGNGTDVELFDIDNDFTSNFKGIVYLKDGLSFVYDHNNPSANVYTISIYAEDEGKLIASNPIEVTVKIRENLNITAPVNNLRYEQELLDAEAGFSYSLVNNENLFALNTRNGKVILSYINTLATLPAEASYELTIEKKDTADKLVGKILLSASIDDAAAEANYSDGQIIEVVEGDLNVANIDITVDDANDVDETAGNIKYYFIGDLGGDRKYFNIDSNSGAITFKETTDYELPFKTSIIETTETVAEVLQRDNRYELTVIAEGLSDEHLGSSLVTRDLVITVTDDIEDNPFILPNRKASEQGGLISYKETNDDSIAEINLFGISGEHDPGTGVINYQFFPDTTDTTDPLVKLPAASTMTISEVKNITDPSNPLTILDTQYPFMIDADGNLDIAPLDANLTPVGASSAVGGVIIDEIVDKYQVTLNDGNKNYIFNINLLAFNPDDFLNTDVVPKITVFEDRLTSFYTFPSAEETPDGYEVTKEQIEETSDNRPHSLLVYFKDLSGVPEASYLKDGYTFVVAPSSFDFTYNLNNEYIGTFDLSVKYTFKKTGIDEGPELVYYKTVRLEIKDQVILYPQNPNNIDLGLSENSDAHSILLENNVFERIYNYLLSSSIAYHDYRVVATIDIVTHGIAVENDKVTENSENLKALFSTVEDDGLSIAADGTITATATGAINDYFRTELKLRDDFDYEKTLVIETGEHIGYTDGYLEHVNTVNIIFNISGIENLRYKTEHVSNYYPGEEKSTNDMTIRLEDDETEIFLVSSASLKIYSNIDADTVLYVAKAVKENELNWNNSLTQYTYSLSATDTDAGFSIDATTGEVKYDGASLDADQTIKVTATDSIDASLIQDFDVTLEFTSGDRPDSMNPTKFIHTGYTDIYAVENNADDILYKIYQNTGDVAYYYLSGDDASFFDINISENAELTFKASPDFEAPLDADMDNVYSVTINALLDETQDNIADYTQAPISLDIHVSDIDDAPLFNVAGETTEFLFVIATDNVEAPVGRLIATDQEEDLINYSVTGGGNIFKVDQNGNILFKNQPTVAETLQGSLKATSKGHSNINISDTIDFTVKVIDGNLPPAPELPAFSSFAQTEDDLSLYTFVDWAG